MREDWKENIRENLQKFMPLLSTMILIILFSIPQYFFVSNILKPYVSIICVYFWTLHRADIFGLGSVFFIGIFEDIITSNPLGTNAVTVLFVYVLTDLISKIITNKPFIIIWYSFILIAIPALVLKWLILSVYYRELLPFIKLFFYMVTTIAVYPIFSIINIYIHKHFMREERL